MSEPTPHYGPDTDPETLTDALNDLAAIYPEPVIVRCSSCKAPWGIRLDRRRPNAPLSAVSCINPDCGKLFLC